MFGDVVTMSKRQAQIILLILILCFAGAFILSYGYVKYINKEKITPTPLPTGQITKTAPEANAVVSLTSDKKSVSTGETFTVSLNLDSGKSNVEAADFVITFDNNFLAAREIKQGSFFGVLPVKNIENSRVKISGMANLVGETIIVPKGKGEVAAIVFEPLRATENTVIKIDPTETIVASAGKNILDQTKTTDLNIEIK